MGLPFSNHWYEEIAPFVFGSPEMEPATRVTPSEKGAASCAVMSVDRTNRSSVNGLAKPTTLLRRLATLLLLPPEISSPQETTEPSLRRAAKANPVEKIWVTVRSLASPLKSTKLLLPPEAGSPQVTTEPSLRRAAKAETVEKIWETVRSPASPLKSTELLSPPEAGSPQVTTEPSLRRAAKAEAVEKIWETVRSPASPLKSTKLLLPPKS